LFQRKLIAVAIDSTCGDLAKAFRDGAPVRDLALVMAVAFIRRAGRWSFGILPSSGCVIKKLDSLRKFSRRLR
jgi:hypothetical protein